MLKKVLQLLILLFTTWSTVSAQNKNALQFTIVSSETGKSINEKSDYSRETTTTFSIRPAPTFYIETEHVLWSNEESPIATFLKSKVGKSLCNPPCFREHSKLEKLAGLKQKTMLSSYVKIESKRKVE